MILKRFLVHGPNLEANKNWFQDSPDKTGTLDQLQIVGLKVQVSQELCAICLFKSLCAGEFWAIGKFSGECKKCLQL